MNPVLRRYCKISDYVVSFSDHGARLCRKHGFNDVTRIWHGVEAQDTFKPWVGEVDQGKKLTQADLRARIGHEADEFLITMIFMNKGNRKMVPETWEGIKLFADRNPDVKTRVHLHTLPNPPEGWDLDGLAQKMGISKLIRWTQEYDVWHSVEPLAMAMLLSASDTLVLTSGTEGFGLPVIEAEACGVPPIVCRYAAQTELVEPVAPELVVKPKALHWQPTMERYCIPDPEGIANALEKVLNGDPERYRKRFREHALKNFDWGVISPQWVDFYTKTLPDLVDKKCLDIPDSAWGKREPQEVVFG